MRRTVNALTAPPDEVPVISTELLEANIAAIRTDLTDLKTDFRAVVARIDQDVRAVASKVESDVKIAVARMDEQFREVRQDIRELRSENKTLRDKMDASHAALDKKIDTKTDELRADIKDIHSSIADLKAMVKAILWVLGGVGTVVAIASAGFTIAKTLHWI